jgi:hypothetical protein
VYFFAQISWPLGTVGLRCGLSALKVLGSSPKHAKKEEQKIQILPGNQKSESNFSRIESEINNQNFGPEFPRDFERPKLRVL